MRNHDNAAKIVDKIIRSGGGSDEIREALEYKIPTCVLEEWMGEPKRREELARRHARRRIVT